MSRRDSSPGRHRRESPSRKRSSPDSSRRERAESELPTEFGGHEDSEVSRRDDDDRNVLERMRSYSGGPLHILFTACKEHSRLKVWTRNFKQIRGICTGFVVAFDKHWNVVLEDVEEVCVKPKKGKSPYLYDVGADAVDKLPEAQRSKKDKEDAEASGSTEVAGAAACSTEPTPADTTDTDTQSEPDGDAEGAAAKSKKRSRKKKNSKMDRRVVEKLFIRGDNVVMVAIVKPSMDIATVKPDIATVKPDIATA